jgi:hypothetical protein
MNARIARTALDPALSNAWTQLQVLHAQHDNGAPFWSAYQAIQAALTEAHPHERVAVCDQLATFAERLGAVEHAHLLGESPAELFRLRGHADSTSP